MNAIARITNLVQAIAELPSALHACVEMARESEEWRGAEAHVAARRDNVRLHSALGIERFISDERWAWARERIELLEGQAEEQLAAIQGFLERDNKQKTDLAREREARRPRRQSEEPFPLTCDEPVLWRADGDQMWLVCEADPFPEMPNVEWRYISPEDMP